MVIDAIETVRRSPLVAVKIVRLGLEQAIPVAFRGSVFGNRVD